ncbi:MAG: PilX N-terminal [Deltaproteobacteria bacterium]|jgi:type IV pilus assembly protein PilX|nr:PilX N-terminal [Deltaproteobacteria bacterium]
MGAKNRLKDQSGTALVISLIMIVVLTLIGLTSIFTSTFETSLSGNKRLSTDSFYIAESRTSTAAKAAPAIDDKAREGTSPFTVESLPDGDSGLSDAEKNSGLKDQGLNRKTTIDASKLDSLALPSGASLNDKSTVTIYHSMATGSSRANLKSDAYTIDTLGTDQIVSGNKSTIQIRMKVVVHRPTDEESQ